MRLKLKTRRIALTVLALLVLAVPVRNYIRDRDIPRNMPSTVRKEVRRLRSPWTHIRWKALVALRGMGEKAAPAAPYVIRMLGWESPLRGEAQDTLVAFGRPAVEPLQGALEDRNPGIRYTAIAVLARMGRPAFEALISALESEDDGVRERAAGGLGRIGDPRAVEPLMRIKGVLWSTAGVKALGQIGDPRAVPALIPLIASKGPTAEAREALLKIGAPSIAPLIDTVKHPYWGGEDLSRAAGMFLPRFGEPALRAMIEAFRDDNRYARENISDNLLHFGSESLLPLIAALKDDDWRVRSGAARALRSVPWPAPVPPDPLLDALKDKRAEVRCEAAATLEARGGTDPRVEGILAAALRDENPMVRWAVAVALVNVHKSAMGAVANPWDDDSKAQWLVSVVLGRAETGSVAEMRVPTDMGAEIRVKAVEQLAGMGRSAAEALTGALKDSDLSVREAATRRLCEMDASEVTDALIDVMRDSLYSMRHSNWIVKWTMETFARTQNTQAVPALVGILEDKHTEVSFRRDAARSLGKIKDPRAVEPLIRQLSHEWAGLRAWSARALGDIGDPRALGPLICVLGDKEPSVRIWSALALGDIGDPRALGPLICVLGDKEPSVRRAASFALKGITGQDFGEDMGKWQEWERTVPGAGSEKESRVTPAIGIPVFLYHGPSVCFHSRRIVALSRLRDPRGVEIVIAGLKDPDWDVVRVAITGLGSFRDKRAADALLNLLNDAGMRQQGKILAAESLGRIGDKCAVDPIMRMLKDSLSDLREGKENPERIESMVNALARLGDPKAIPVLEETDRAARVYAAKRILENPSMKSPKGGQDPSQVLVSHIEKALQDLGKPLLDGLEASVSTSKPAFKLGEPIIIQYEMKNAGQQTRTVCFKKAEPLPDNLMAKPWHEPDAVRRIQQKLATGGVVWQFTITVDGKGSLAPMEGLMVTAHAEWPLAERKDFVVLSPGKSYRCTMNLLDYDFVGRFSTPGQYSVYVEYENPYSGEEFGLDVWHSHTEPGVRSNRVSFAIQ